jgi:uncharacterized protein with NAD-binding domain and iron-sulfur cluster
VVKVVVIGGGVAGLSAAHELARRDVDVVVYEQRDVAGGKARSMDAIPGTGGRRALPGEHGFRFFPGFYRHLPDTMTRIPYGRNIHGVFDNLVASTQIQIAREGKANELVAPAQFPENVGDWEAAMRFGLEVSTHLGIPLDDQVHFVKLLSDLLSACDARMFGQYENQSWWEFSGAEHRSPAFQRFLADGLTRTLVAARGKEMSARTGGSILLALLQDLSTPGANADRVLNGPTSDVWITPWVHELERLGVDLRLGSAVEAIESRHGRVTGVSGAGFSDKADHYIAAVPVEVLRERIAMDALKRHSPLLAGLDTLQVRWMNGIMFYLRRDAPLIHGHTIYSDSAWALTSISQRQFWPQFDLHAMGDGEVGGLLSIDVSDWETPGAFAAKGKIARQCSKEEIAEEVWAQLKAALNDGTEVLADANRLAWFLDPDIVPPNPTDATNLEPLLVAAPPARRAARGRQPLPRLGLRADLHRPGDDGGRQRGSSPRRQRDPEGERLGCGAVRRVEAPPTGRPPVPARARGRPRHLQGLRVLARPAGDSRAQGGPAAAQPPRPPVVVVV